MNPAPTPPRRRRALRVLGGFGVLLLLALATLRWAPAPMLRGALEDASGGSVQVHGAQVENWGWSGPRRLRAAQVTFHQPSSWIGVQSLEAGTLILEAPSAADLAAGRLSRLAMERGILRLGSQQPTSDAREPGSAEAESKESPIPHRLDLKSPLEIQIDGFSGSLRVSGSIDGLPQLLETLTGNPAPRPTTGAPAEAGAGVGSELLFEGSDLLRSDGRVALLSPRGRLSIQPGGELQLYFFGDRLRAGPPESSTETSDESLSRNTTESTDQSLPPANSQELAAREARPAPGPAKVELRAPRLALTKSVDAPWVFFAEAEQLQLSSPRPALESPRIEARLSQIAEDLLELEATPTLIGLGSGFLQLRLRQTPPSSTTSAPAVETTLFGRRLESVQLWLEGLDLDLVLPWLPVPSASSPVSSPAAGWWGQGQLDLIAQLGDTDDPSPGLNVEAGIQAPRLELRANSGEGLAGEGPVAEGLIAEQLEAGLLWRHGGGEILAAAPWLEGAGSLEIALEDLRTEQLASFPGAFPARATLNVEAPRISSSPEQPTVNDDAGTVDETHAALSNFLRRTRAEVATSALGRWQFSAFQTEAEQGEEASIGRLQGSPRDGGADSLEPPGSWPTLRWSAEELSLPQLLTTLASLSSTGFSNGTGSSESSGSSEDAAEPPVHSRGALELSGTLSGLPNSPSMEMLLAAPELELWLPQAQLSEAPQNAAGEARAAEFRGDLRSRWTASWPAVTNSGTSAGNSAQASPALEIQLSSLTLRGQANQLTAVPLPLALEASGRGSPSGTLELSSLVLDLGVRGRVEGRGHFHSAGGAVARFRARDLALEPWRRLLIPSSASTTRGEAEVGDSAASPEGSGLETLELTGHVESDLYLQSVEDGWTLVGDLHLVEGGFSDTEGARILQGLGGEGALHGRFATATGIAELQGRAELDGFQLLWDAFYGDYDSARSHLAFSWHRGDSEEASLRWRLPGKVRVQAQTQRMVSEQSEAPRNKPERWQARAMVDVEDAGAAWAELLAEPLEGLDPELAATRLQGGLHLFLGADGGGGETGFNLRGLLTTSTPKAGDVPRLHAGSQIQSQPRPQLLGLELATTLDGDPVELSGLRLRLPFAGRWDQGRLSPATGQPPRRGLLALSSARFRDLRLGATTTALAVQGDGFQLEEALRLPLLGGELTLERLTVEESTADPRLSAGLRLDGLDLERLATTLQTLPLEGTLEAIVPRVQLYRGVLTLDGGAEARLFGGRVLIGEVTGRDVLSLYPRITFSADLEELDLGQLTRRFDFGEMNGVLEGRVDHLELFRGVPVALSAELRTVRRSGVSQFIGLKAVNNIALVGTGASASGLESSLLGLLDRFTYRQLGIAMELQDDRFLLRGLVRENGVEYFLRGRLPFPIHVVNAQPGQTVSFQSMLDRLQALELDRAAPNPAAPNPASSSPTSSDPTASSTPPAAAKTP
ncbi:MAG: hypothetical protein AAGD01_08615 [Acidobacteriota bacterium]